MDFIELDIAGVWVIKHAPHNDERGSFHEWYKTLEAHTKTNSEFKVSQANISTSKKNVLRGIHCSNVQGGQGKWVTCVTGSIWDVIVDLRPNSPTFKEWRSVELNSKKPMSIYVPGGVGHGFLALEDENIVTYLLTSPYDPGHEFEINPFDSELNIKWPTSEVTMSPKDRLAPNLKDQSYRL